MPRESSRRLRGLLGSCLLGGSFAAASCRIGYEDVGSSGGAGLSGAAGAKAPSGGAGSSNGGGAAVTAGEGAVGGASDLPTAGAAANGGDSSAAGDSSTAGAGGKAGSTSAGGVGGEGPTPSCTATTDCSCASNDGHVYWFCKAALDWDGAQAQCETQAMHLVRIDSQLENDFLVGNAAASGVFLLNGFAQIGANDRAVAGEWRWVDGELFWQGGPMGTPVAGLFSSWLASSPSASGIQQCSGLLDTGKWQVRSCTAVVPFICESP